LVIAPSFSLIVFVYKPHDDIFREGVELLFPVAAKCLPIAWVFGLHEKLKRVYKFLRTEYFQLAQKHRLPVIDLSETFDHTNRAHYGSTTIEPSDFSGMVIAQLIKTIIDQHDFDGPSKIYLDHHCQGNITSIANDEGDTDNDSEPPSKKVSKSSSSSTS